MMDLPAPAPMYCHVIEVACEQERAGPLLKLTLSDAEKDTPFISVVAVFERMDDSGAVAVLAARLDDTLLPPENNLLKIGFKTGIVDQRLV